jgi:hypothetical protein
MGARQKAPNRTALKNVSGVHFTKKDPKERKSYNKVLQSAKTILGEK